MTKILLKIRSAITAISKWKTLLAIFVLSGVVIFIYQPCYLDYTRSDAIGFFIERNSFQSDWSWFLHAVNYNRTRYNNPGDYFLFRPGLFAVLTLYDIFFRDSPLITGVTSIVLFLLVVILLFVTFKTHFKESAALPFAALFASQCLGVELVVWRHVSFYMLGPGLTLASFLILLSNLRHKYVLAWIGFFSGMMFYDIISPTALTLIFVLLMVIMFRGRGQGQEKISVPMATLIISVALFIYLLSDFINWKIISPPSFLGPAEHFTLNFALLKDAAWKFFLYLGAGARTVFNPFSMVLTWDKSMTDHARYSLYIRQEDARVYFIWAAVGGGSLIASLAVVLSRIFARKHSPADVITLWACCGVITLTGIFSFFRLTLRDLSYSWTATYNYWFFYLFYIIIVKFLVDEILKLVPSSWWKKAICIVGYIILTIVVIAQACKARDSIAENYDLTWAKQIVQAVRTSELYFTLNPDACLDPSEQYLGVPPRNRQFFTLPYYLNKYNCGRGPGTSVVHLYRTNEGITSIRPGPYPDKQELN